MRGCSDFALSESVVILAEYSYAMGSGVFGIEPREASQLGEEYRCDCAV